MLETISDISAGETHDMEAERDEVVSRASHFVHISFTNRLLRLRFIDYYPSLSQLSQLWTMLGGNKGKLRNFEFHGSMLAKIGSYHKQAQNHVSSTLYFLRQLDAELKNLRGEVALPALLDDHTYIPLEKHLDTIWKAVERLEAGQVRAAVRREETARLMSGRAEA